MPTLRRVLLMTCRPPHPLHSLRQPRKHQFSVKPDARCKKVHNVPVANEHLLAECNSKLIARYSDPKRGPRRCERAPHFMGALGEEDLAVELLTRLIVHGQ